MIDYGHLLIGIAGASLVFVIKERVSTFIESMGKDKVFGSPNLNVDGSVVNERHRQSLIIKEIAKAMEIDSPFWEVNRDLTIMRGDRISFVDKEVGFVQGDFIGLKRSDLVGYSDIYVIKNNKESTIREASIDYVEEGTINVYK